MSDYYSHARTELVALLPKDKDTKNCVLEFGCGSGATSALIRSEQSNVHEPGVFATTSYSNIKIGPVRPKKRLSYRLGKILFGDSLTKEFLVTAQNLASAQD